MIDIGVLCGDKWHPASDVMYGLQAAVNDGVRFERLPQAEELNDSWMKNKDVIVLAKINHASEEDTSAWLTADMKEAMMEYVAGGGGLAVIHAGTVCYKDDAEFCKFIGGAFAYHPEPCPITLTFHASAAQFLGENPADIFIYDEHYMMDMADDAAQVFMASESEHGVQSAGWVKHYGKGRICVLTPGHFREVWQQSGYQKLIDRALRWCAGETDLQSPMEGVQLQ